jgi:hypothetical protein
MAALELLKLKSGTNRVSALPHVGSGRPDAGLESRHGSIA